MVRVETGGGFAWDEPVHDLLDALAPVASEEVHPDPVLQAITFGLTAAAGVLALVWLYRRRIRDALFLVAAIGGAVLLSTLVKELVQRPPIEGGGDYSFPSGSATWSMALAAAAVLLAPAQWRRLALVLGGLFVLGFGAVIVWEEWHYSSDVLAGWLLALAWVLGLRFALYRS